MNAVNIGGNVQKYMQYTCNETLSRFRATIVAVENQ